ncbi:Glutathione synthase N-terminal eukaryotic [Penicillium brevicompactum]|uniref:Glutathione synthetase n=1 Tax=Penicillium brevicompactum TaxID=5074 RepID=A0A9W9UM20_PENBR|nr:Glutathione synthase N-terminal eukaryotic [Penicillium brevicompactum]
MAQSIYSNYPPELSAAQQKFLVTAVKDWAIHNGLAVRPGPTVVPEGGNPNGVLATNAPVTLFPSPFPRTCFTEATALQEVYNKLYASITCNEEWLGEIVKGLIEVDDFVANLWKVHLAVQKEGYAQNLALGLYRSDYMAHVSPAGDTALKQVEFNTISSSFGGLSALVRQMHTELLTSPPGSSINYPSHPLLQSEVPPENTAVETLSSGLAVAHKAYGASKSTPALPLCVAFVVQDTERNVFDQHALSEHLKKTHNIPRGYLGSNIHSRRQLIPTTALPPPHSPDSIFEVTTVYLRAYYSPDEYTSSRDWEARTHLERSAAIKCPTVLNQLSGCKKVQQVLAEPTGLDHLTGFLNDVDASLIERVRATFAPQYDLSPNSKGRELALNPETALNHVLKPQREGGGNNVYKADIPGFLQSLPESDWKGWVLMELINPASNAQNVALRNDGEVLRGDVISELGVYGTILWEDTGKILHNNHGGYLLRTKGKEVNEGGVAAGFSSLDSVLLF